MGVFSRTHALPTPAQVYAVAKAEGRYWVEAALDRWGGRVSEGSLRKLLRQAEQNASAESASPTAGRGAPAASIPPGRQSRRRFADSEIAGALSVTGGHQGKAAALLGCHIDTVYKYGQRQRDLGL